MTQNSPPAQAAAPAADENLWSIVLAAGEGKRLAPVTRLVCGREVPKQFVAFDGDRTLLQRTMDRLQPLCSPQRTVVVVARERHELAEAQLARYPGVQIVLQPKNLGTGPGLLLPLAHVRAADPEATVVVTPSDHYIPFSEAFRAALRQAARMADEAPAGIALLGAEADEPASDLGWIVPDRPAAVQREGKDLVAKFVEKPPLPVASQLLARGGLWNTLILVGRADAFWRQARQHLPAQTAAFDEYAALLVGGHKDRMDEALATTYRSMPSADLSRALLEKARGLAVVALRSSGWCDCGTPERLLATLNRISGKRPPSPFLEAMVRLLRAQQEQPAAP